jgi:phosphonate transport system substrate-binding protein
VRARPNQAGITLIRDVLTGRLLDEQGRPAAPTAGWGSAKKPIRVRFVPSSDQTQSGPTLERLLEFLRDRTGYAVEGATLRSYGAVIEELLSGRCDIAFLTATSYMRALAATENNGNDNDDIVAFLQVVRRGSPAYPGSELSYRAALIVRNDSPLESVEDITSETSVALGAKTSGASGLLPMALLNQLGKQPRITWYEGTYPLIVSAVLQGSADVGSVWWSAPNDEMPHNDARIVVAQSHPDVFDKTRIIGFTGWMPNEPVVARSLLPASVRDVFARALTLYASLMTVTEEGRKELMAMGSPIGFIPATNDDFVSLREVIDQAFANDPEGKADFMAVRR